MKRAFGLLLIALSTMVASACETASRNGRSAQSPAPIANVTVSLSPASPWAASPFGSQPFGENVALHGYATGSTRDAAGLLTVAAAAAHLAIDGSSSSVWSANQPAPQWFSVALDDLYLVNRIQLEVTQAPAGPTTHQIWLGNGSGTRTLFATLSRVHTDDGQLLDIRLDPPQIVEEVFVVTLDSPSWVAWREIKVFGLPHTQSLDSVSQPRLTLQPIASGLHLPVQVTHAGDQSGRLFVAEKEGRIGIVHYGETLETPFLDISSRVLCCVHRGLIDIVFPPSTAAASHFYISYTNLDGHTVISRFQISQDPNQADPESEEVVLTIEQPAEHHNGGHMEFGPKDGYLYIASGDGGLFSYPDNPALDHDTLLSKLLRIDVESGEKPYRIPDTNPFARVTGYSGEIWALGLRNPGNFAFDAQTGDLFIPDSGNRRREEINFQPASSPGGEDYGWFRMEANLCFDNFVVPCSADSLTLPVAEYDHSQGCAVSGGAVYRGHEFPDLQGLFLFADLCSGRIWGLKRPAPASQTGWQSTLLLNAPISISSIGQDEVGNLYAASFDDGVLYQLSQRSDTTANESAFSENVALRGSGRASARGDAFALALDGDPATAWHSGLPPPQWFSVLLDDLYLIDQIELVFPPDAHGPVTLELWLGNGSGVRTLYKRLNSVRPSSDRLLAIPIDPPQRANELLLIALHGQLDVSLHEVRVFSSLATHSRADNPFPQVRLDQTVSGLDLPVLITHAGDGTNRIFIAEQKGRIRILQDGRLLERPFLDISDRVACCGEQGLFGLAFPPSYAESQRFYVSYSNLSGDTVVSRFVTSDDPDIARRDTEEVLLTLDQPDKIHNGGHLSFGPQDGYLYVGSGDGGTFRDPDNLAQRPDTLLGKILRIDVESGAQPYAVPADNPFNQTEGFRPEIWALGLRNPWGFAFDRATGDLYIPDVGGSSREEVNVQPSSAGAGRNYGWAVMEGNTCFPHDSLVCNAAGLVSPVAEYDHAQGCAVVGGAVYRGAAFPALQGVFLFADFCRGAIWGLKRTGRNETGQAESSWQSARLANAGFPISSIGQDEAGNVYAAGYQDGTIYMITSR